MPKPHPTIGVFDSGFGGLTVLRALLTRIAGAHYIYLGDTARLPYGAKSKATIARYAVESARFLEDSGAEFLVIACNTASALALDEIRSAVRVPVVGVIEPGARAAFHALASPSEPDVLVLATDATVQSHAYRAECAALGLHAMEVACPLLVPLVEEGWTDHPVTPAIQRALRHLGCEAPVIDSAEATATVVAAAIAGSPSTQQPATNNPQPATFACYATDSVEKFQRLGTHFLGQPIPKVELLDLGG